MLVAGARRSPAPTACADETEYRVVVRERRNPRRSAACAGMNGGGWNESTPRSTNAREIATLNQPPDGRAGHTERATRLLDGNHVNGHGAMVSRPSHCLNRITPLTAGRRPMPARVANHSNSIACVRSEATLVLLAGERSGNGAATFATTSKRIPTP